MICLSKKCRGCQNRDNRIGGLVSLVNRMHKEIDDKKKKYTEYILNPKLEAICEHGYSLKDHLICEIENCNTLVCPKDLPKVFTKFLCIHCQKKIAS